MEVVSQLFKVPTDWPLGALIVCVFASGASDTTFPITRSFASDCIVPELVVTAA